MTRRTSTDAQGRSQASADVRVPHTAPANDPPALKTSDAIVAEFGFKSARALRDWCRSRGVRYKPDGKMFWVDRNDVVAAITQKPTYVPPPKSAPPTVEGWVDATLKGGRRG